jgi:hypothetical protein
MSMYFLKVLKVHKMIYNCIHFIIMNYFYFQSGSNLIGISLNN